MFSGQDQRSSPCSGCSMTACRSLTPPINLSLTLPHSPPRIATAAQGAQPLAAQLLRQAPFAVCRHLGRCPQALPGVPVPRPAPSPPWGDGTRCGTWLQDACCPGCHGQWQEMQDDLRGFRRGSRRVGCATSPSSMAQGGTEYTKAQHQTRPSTLTSCGTKNCSYLPNNTAHQLCSWQHDVALGNAASHHHSANPTPM